MDIFHVLETKISHLKENETMQNHTHNHLSVVEMSVIQKMIAISPDSFHSINNHINETINTPDKFELKDLLKIVHNISSIYIQLFDPKEISIIGCIKFTIDAILDSGLLPFPNIEIRMVKKIVDVSLDFLETNLPTAEEVEEEKKEIKHCFSSIFKFIFCFSG